MEVYLNVAETGIGTYGVEAGAQRYFKHSAARLTRIEAARIAAALPSPKKRAVVGPGGFTRRHGNTIAARTSVVRTARWMPAFTSRARAELTPRLTHSPAPTSSLPVRLERRARAHEEVFVDHVDHVAWISRPEISRRSRQARGVRPAKLEKFQRDDMGFVMYISWEAGLEMVAPLPFKTDFNQMLYDWLETRGEGVNSVVFGVRGLEEHKARLEKLGYTPGPVMDDHPDSPWHDRSASTAGRRRLPRQPVILGDIGYADGVIPFEDS